MITGLTMNAVVILGFCSSLLTLAQDKDSYRINLEKAKQIAASVERTINVKEPKWKLKKTLQAEQSVHQYWQSGTKELSLSILIYDSVEEASKMLERRSHMSSVARPDKLEDLGDEAYYMTHRYFSSVGVRKGRAAIEVKGPGPALTITKRFAQYALEQIEDQ